MTDIAQAAGRFPRPKHAVPSDSPPEKRGNGLRVWLGRMGTLIFVACVVGPLVLAWRVRSAQHLTAESGLGYALGIVGATMMLLLLLYPLRKKARFMRHFGSVRRWFRLHMALGILGPALILIHANFQLGSLNSNVALFAMLFVMASGLVGRFFYGKIHLGLYGRQANLAELRSQAASIRRRAGMDIPEFPRITERLRAFESEVLSKRYGVARRAWDLVTLGTRARWFRRNLMREVEETIHGIARVDGWTRHMCRVRRRAARKYISAYLANVIRVAEFTFYDRLFGLWHILHLPLFFILVLAAIAHIVAVHLY